MIPVRQILSAILFAFLLSTSCLQAQAFGYYVLQNPPSVNKLHQVRSLTLWRTALDTVGNPVGPALKEREYQYYCEGRIITETVFDSADRICRLEEYRNPVEDDDRLNLPEVAVPPIYDEMLVFKGPNLQLVEHYRNDGKSHYTPYWFFKPCYGDYLYTYRTDSLVNMAYSVSEKEIYPYRTPATCKSYWYWSRYDFHYQFWEN